jgi:predicted dienelactone hydrolase
MTYQPLIALFVSLAACSTTGPSARKADAGPADAPRADGANPGFSDGAVTGQRDSTTAGDTTTADDARASSDAAELAPLEVAWEDVAWKTASELAVPARIYAPTRGSPGAPYPAVAFSHGLGESRASFGYFGRELAKNGFIVLFVTHPGSDSEAIRERDDSGGPRSDFGSPELARQRMEALSFAIDQLVAADPGSALLQGRVDPARIAVAGQCAGSSTAAALAGLEVAMLETDFRDPRARALVLLGPQPPAPPTDAYVPESAWPGVDVPSLTIVGSKDFGWVREVRADPTLLERPYALMSPLPKALVALEGAGHHAFTDSMPYYPAGPRDPEHHGCITRATVAFLRAVLDDDRAASEWLANPTLREETSGACSLSGRGFDDTTDEDVPHGELYKASSGPHTVHQIETIEITDPARSKPLQLRVSYPEVAQPAPLILFSHALFDSKDDYPALIAHWVSHGYLCIQVDHIDSSNLGQLDRPEALAQWPSRPVDLSVVLDHAPQLVQQAPVLAEKIDLTRIAAAGAYIGGGSANLLLGTKVYDEREPDAPPVLFTDERVALSLALSPAGLGQGMRETSWADIDKPMMVITGSENHSARTGNPASWRTAPYRYSPPGGKYLLWIEGLRGDYDGLAAQPKPGSTIVPQVLSATTAFFDAELKGEPAARRYLRSNALAELTAGQATVTSK